MRYANDNSTEDADLLNKAKEMLGKCFSDEGTASCALMNGKQCPIMNGMLSSFASIIGKEAAS